MKKIIAFFKKEMMLTVALLAAVISLFITPPSRELLGAIDWKTLATLFMLLSVLDGFKTHDLFRPVIRLAQRFRTQRALSFFLVFSVFLSSMFVTNDVSLIIFVPLTILLFRMAGHEKYILPVLALENAAAVRGSLLTPFGSPQNLFLFARHDQSAMEFMLMMLPLWLGSIVILSLLLLFLYRREPALPAEITQDDSKGWQKEGRELRAVYFTLFAVIVATIVSRTSMWPVITLAVTAVLLIYDPKVFRRVDYVLLLTFLCFFVFSSSISRNAAVSGFMNSSVKGNEYWWSLGLSQIISNVPAAIVLDDFSGSLKALIYGLDTAGLVTIIGSLASVINLRLYLREYPGRSKDFLITFEKWSLVFFLIVLVPQWLLCR